MARELPSVSVIISTYNRPTYLKRAIKSVIAQSFQDWELLVVDDCSPNADENLNIVSSFNDSRITYVKTDKNYGHDGHPKNLGIQKAVGEFVAFIDDDDQYRVDALKILHTYAKESEADVVYGDYLIGDATKGNKKSPGWSLDFNVAMLTRMNYISMCVSMVRKDALMKVGGFDEDVPKFKDWNLWLRLQKSGHLFLHVPIMVTEVESLEDSISSKYKVQYDGEGHYLPTFFDPANCTIYPKTTCLGEKKPLRVAVYTMTWNRWDYTKKMLESLKTASYPFDLFIVDQGSVDETKKHLDNMDLVQAVIQPDHILGARKVYIQRNDKNVGLAEGWNQCIDLVRKTGDYDIVVKVDNDAQLMTDGWLRAMVDLFDRNSMLILSPYVEGLEKSPGGVMRQRLVTDNPYYVMNETVLGSVPNLGGIVFAHHIRMLEGWRFDSSYKGNKDFLLSQSARRAGYAPFYMEEFRVWHIDGTKGQHERYPEYFQSQDNQSTNKDL